MQLVIMGNLIRYKIHILKLAVFFTDGNMNSIHLAEIILYLGSPPFFLSSSFSFALFKLSQQRTHLIGDYVGRR